MFYSVYMVHEIFFLLKYGLWKLQLEFSSMTFSGCGGKVRFPLLLFRSSVFWVNHARFSSKSLLRFPSTFSSKSCSKTWYHCKFLIHSGSLQKMLTALFNLVWNTQKSKWTILFECQCKMFLCIEKVLEKICEDQH